LTGAVPFQGEDAVATLKLHKNLPAPNLRDVRADIPPRLSALVREMLAKEALERPPSMEAIVFRLRAVKEALETRAPQKTFSVLVVDDDVALGKLMGMYAQRALPEAEVRVVEDAERALLAVRDRAPDAMLLDLHMPRMNGIELCMMLRGARLADQCTIIAVSAGAREADIDLLKQLGITRFVSKGAEIGARINPLLRELHEAWKRSRGADRTMTTTPGIRTMPSGSNLVGAGHASTAPSSVRGKAVLDVVVPRSGTADLKVARGGGRIDEKRLELLRQLAQLLPEERVTLVDADLQDLLAELRRD
jgi:DNA-binding response OmpR family regulator